MLDRLLVTVEKSFQREMSSDDELLRFAYKDALNEVEADIERVMKVCGMDTDTTILKSQGNTE
jgi:hypothetical protein